MRRITAFSLDNQRITIVFIVLLIAAGIAQFINHPRREDPAIVIREAIVAAHLPGVEPTKVEDLITRWLEEEIRTIQEVDEIRSESKTGTSLIHVTLRDEVAPERFDDIWKDLRAKMSDVQPALPDGTLGPFVDDDFGDTAVATIALWSDGFSLAEMRIVARRLRDRLHALDGVRKVELFGVQEERVFLEFSNAKLAELGISPGVIADTLAQQNILFPGGGFDVEGRDVIIEPSGNFESVDDIRQALIPIPGTQQVANLRDLLSIKRGFVDPPDKPVFFDGRPAIVLSVAMLDGVNAVEFGERLTARVRALEATLPIGYVLDFATFQPALVEKTVNGALLNVYQTLAVVLVVVMLFLGVRTGLIVGVFVPMAMLLGIVVMSRVGVELERVSIASMIIALGLLVDNGIVIAEEIRSRLERGEARRDACLAAGQTLAIPLLTSTLTTVFAFVPMLLVTGSAGEFVRSLGLVIGILLVGSWFLSMYATPALAYWFMRVKPRPAVEATARGPYAGPVYRGYRGVLEALLRARLAFLALVVAALVVTGVGARFVVKEFFPPGDRNQFLVYFELPAGTNTAATAAVVQRYTAWLKDKAANPEVTDSIAYIGSGGPRFFLSLAPIDPDPHLAFVVVNTETAAQVPGAVARSRARLLAAFPEVRGRVKPMWLGGTETGLLEVRLIGPDADELYAKAIALIEALAAIPGTLDVKHDWDDRVIKIRVLVDQQRARRAGLTSQEVALSVSSYIDGTEITDYREGDALIPVIVRAAKSERAALGAIRDVAVYSATRGVNVPLSQVADFEAVWQFSRIKRRDQERTITVSAKHQFLKAGQLLAALEPAIGELALAPGHRSEVGGEIEASAEAQGKLFGKMPFAFAAIVVLLIWQFNSFRRPAIILITVPLSFIGGILGLLAMNAVLSFFAILGFFSLAGITIINNGIVLIDRIDAEIAAGKAAYDAVIGAALARFRPIVMTTLTTILGLMPLIISRDPLFFGLASLIAFGLAVGTVLTLGVVPVLYTLLFRVAIPRRGTAAAAAV